jgi:CheY-like chemotaxis protein
MIKVLVADDNPEGRELIREVLQSGDCQVLEAADGKEALESTRLNRPDVVLLDVQMPVMDGFSVLRQLRQDPSLAALPVAAVTAYAMHGDRESMLAAGFDDYIAKPIHPASLRNSIARLLDRKA